MGLQLIFCTPPLLSLILAILLIITLKLGLTSSHSDKSHEFYDLLDVSEIGHFPYKLPILVIILIFILETGCLSFSTFFLSIVCSSW